MRTLLKSLREQIKAHKAKVEDSELPEGEKTLQIEICKSMARYFGNREREYNKDSAKLLKERIK